MHKNLFDFSRLVLQAFGDGNGRLEVPEQMQGILKWSPQPMKRRESQNGSKLKTRTIQIPWDGQQIGSMGR